MKTCHTCRRQIFEVPFRWHGGLEIFCGEACLPEGMLDEPHALAYSDLLAMYNEYVERLADVENWSQRDELLSEIDYCEGQCAEYVLGDSEGFYYKKRLRHLHQWFTDLYDKTANYLLNWDHYQFDTGLMIYWKGIIQDSSKEVAVALQMKLEAYMKENDLQPLHLHEHPFDALHTTESILVFPQSEFYKDSLGQEALQDMYEICVDFFDESPVSANFHLDVCIELTKLFTCPLCSCLEPIDGAAISEDHQIYACDYCSTK
ncbi:hypothetical protein ACXYMX_04285 [Sporosarcina sp. CAU 1771]